MVRAGASSLPPMVSNVQTFLSDHERSMRRVVERVSACDSQRVILDCCKLEISLMSCTSSARIVGVPLARRRPCFCMTSIMSFSSISPR